MKTLGLFVVGFILYSLSLTGGIDTARAEIPAISEDTTVYFYNSETNINNFASLKMAFDTGLAQLGNMQFQPFSNRDTFEELVASQKDGVFLLSSWHYRLLKKQWPLKPVLVGTVQGRTSQSKVLSVNSSIGDIDALKGMRIASSGSEDYTRTVLERILGGRSGDILDHVKWVLVPKDLDALMALGFGMADAALTAESSLDSLAKINVKQYNRLKRIGTSQQQLLMLGVISESARPNTLHAVERLTGVANISLEGGNALRMLGLDGFRKLTAAELKELE
ncbi:MAG: hypothetical protein Kow0065_19550 [Methylomicrobium sp.]